MSHTEIVDGESLGETFEQKIIREHAEYRTMRDNGELPDIRRELEARPPVEPTVCFRAHIEVKPR